MKAKLNLDSARLKQGLSAHGEKIVLALFVFLAVMVIWSAVALPRYDRKPQDLVDDTRRGRDTLAGSHKDPLRFDVTQDGVKLPAPGNTFDDKINRELLNPIAAANFAGTTWNRPLVESKERRREPTYLALRDLRATYTHTALSFKGAGGGENDKGIPTGEEWITVTGLVPFDDQAAAYSKAFDKAIDPLTNAIPRYRVYEIRRAELTSLDPNEAIDWDQIAPLNLQENIAAWMSKFSGSGAELAATPAVYWPPLTEPVPPTTNKEVGGWALHPEMAKPAVDVPAPTTAPQPQQPEAPKFDAFGRPITAAAAPAPAPAPVAQAAAVETAAPQKRSLLFRFFDFNIEPGKRYRYMVKLVLDNPNYKLDLAHLEKPELAAGETRETSWSPPSPPIGVPYHDRYYAGDVVKSLSGEIEPTQDVTVRWWFPALAAEGLVTFEAQQRGALLNSPTAKVVYPNPATGSPESKEEAFRSDAVLLDFSWERSDSKLRGPSDRPAAVNRPAEVLVVNHRGELTIRSQLTDWERGVGESTQMFDAPAAVAEAATTDQPAKPADPTKSDSEASDAKARLFELK